MLEPGGLWDQLPECTKILIEGNHDLRSRWRTLPWDLVVRKAKQPFYMTYRGMTLAMAHWPEKLEHEHTDYCIHGHIHNLGKPVYEKNGCIWVNVSVEHWNYKPIALDEII